MSTRDKLKIIQKEFCRMCEEVNGPKDIDECFYCIYYKSFNAIFSDIN